MKIKKYLIVMISILFGIQGIFADSSSDFKQLCAKLSKVNIVRGEFELSQFVKKNNRNVNSSGKYTISAKDGMIWFTESPVQSVMAVTKEYIVQDNKGRQRKMDGSKNPTFAHMAEAISSLFTGKYEEIYHNFDVECSLTENSKSVWNIILTPKDKTIASYISKIQIQLNDLSGGCHITQIIMVTINGDSSTYRLKNQVLTDNLNSDEAKYFE